MSSEMQVLVLGAEGTGKTLLLKRLQIAIQDEQKEYEMVPSTVSTIGTNIVTIAFSRRKINFRELGGAMAPIWKNFYADCNAVIFLIDVSNNFQLSASTMLFYDVLKAENLSKLPVLLVFNKADLHSSLSIKEFKFILRLSDLEKHSTQKITTTECSLKTGAGILDIKNWLVSV